MPNRRNETPSALRGGGLAAINEALGDELIEAIGLRNRMTEEAPQATQQRHYAFHLFWRAYDQIRRAVTFLRWDEGDVDLVVPSLYLKHKVARKRPAPAATLGTEASPLTEPDGMLPIDREVATSDVQTTAGQHGAGLPGADPFLH